MEFRCGLVRKPSAPLASRFLKLNDKFPARRLAEMWLALIRSGAAETNQIIVGHLAELGAQFFKIE
jgi:hypothetical protein